MKRVIAKIYTTYSRYSDEYTDTLIQYLQEQKHLKLFGYILYSYWKTIDTETVPTYAWLQANCLGFTDWKSKWTDMPNILWTKLN